MRLSFANIFAGYPVDGGHRKVRMNVHKPVETLGAKISVEGFASR